MSVFQASGLVTARQVAERYGIRFGAGGRAFCPFHNDVNRPALSFKDRIFTCFACGAHGDSIDFVAAYEEVSLLEAAKIINADFALGLSDEPPTDAERRAWAERKQQQEDAKTQTAQALNLLCWADLYIRRQRPTSWEDMTPVHRQLLAIGAEIGHILDTHEIPDWGWKVVKKVDTVKRIMDGAGQPMLGNDQHRHRNGQRDG